MKKILEYFSTSVGRKLLMGLNGLFLCRFLVVPLYINLFILKGDAGQEFGAYATFMSEYPLLRPLEIVLFAGFILHMVLGILLWAAERRAAFRRDVAEIGWLDSQLIGLAQAVTLIPGSSRSGTTMTAAMFLGLTREAGGRFSFLLGIPAIGGLMGVTRDVTERRKMEESLRDSERRYRLLAENITDVIWAADMNLNRTYVSPSAKSLQGYKCAEDIPHNVKICSPRRHSRLPERPSPESWLLRRGRRRTSIDPGLSNLN